MQGMLPPLCPSGRRERKKILRIAHRGGAAGGEDYRAENMLRLAEVGMHLVEVDLRTTRDGRLVVVHDPAIRMDGRDRLVSSLTLAEAADGGAVAFGEVVAAARNAGLGLYVDVKELPARQAHELAGMLAGERVTGGAIVASDDPVVVARLSRAVPDVPRAVLFRDVDVDAVGLARRCGADFVHPCWEALERPDRLVGDRWLENVRRAGLGVVSWHEERPEVIDRLCALGVDGICTDDPELLSAVVEMRA